MVADDEPVNRKMLRIILDKIPACNKVFLSENGQQLLDQVAANPDDAQLIISDIMMPGMNGPEAVAKIFTETRSSAFVVFVSGGNLRDDDKEILQELLQDERVLGVMAKPFSRDDVHASFFAACSLDDEARREDSRKNLRALTRDAALPISNCNVRDLPDRFQKPKLEAPESL